LLLLIPLWPQQQKQQPESGELRLVSDVQLVLLDASVRRKSGGTYVRGLTRDHFRIFDNGKPAEITTFHEADLPVTLGLVIDASGSMTPKRRETISAALLLLAENHPEDEVFLIAFNDSVASLLPADTPFTSDRQLLRDALMRHPAKGRTALHDGIEQGIEHLQQGSRQRKALVVISDGGDNASRTSEQELLRLAQDSHATIFTIGIYDLSDPDRNPGLLRRLAQWTGGEAFFPRPGGISLEDATRRIARDLRSRYLLGFAPAQSATPQRRKIRVTAASPEEGKLKVRARQFYFAGPPTSEGASQ
jgi:Ca-activated chloride channel family protein